MKEFFTLIVFGLFTAIGFTGCKAHQDDKSLITSVPQHQPGELASKYQVELKNITGNPDRVERFKVEEMIYHGSVLGKNIRAEFRTRRYQSTKEAWKSWKVIFNCRQVTRFPPQIHAFSDDQTRGQLGLLYDFLKFDDCVAALEYLMARMKHPEFAGTDILFSIDDNANPLLTLTSPPREN